MLMNEADVAKFSPKVNMNTSKIMFVFYSSQQYKSDDIISNFMTIVEPWCSTLCIRGRC